MSKIEMFETGVGEVQFMWLASPRKNEKSGKEEYTIRILLSDTDAAVSHLKSIADYKVDTKTNRALSGSGQVSISFASYKAVNSKGETFDDAPTVIGLDGAELSSDAIPRFDSRKDKATAKVTYKVIDYGNTKLVRLEKVTLVSLEMAPREAVEVTKGQINAIG